MREDIPRLCLLSMGVTLGVLYLARVAKPHVVAAGVLTTTYLGAAYWVSSGKSWFATSKKRAWVLSLAIALPLGPASLAYDVYLMVTGKLWKPEAYFESHPAADAAATAFLSFLVLDSVVGNRQYREQFGLVEGWLHHVGYTLVCVEGLRGPFTTGLLSSMNIEVTTIILSIGRIWPEHRSDVLFGVAFFLIRIVWCVYVMLIVMRAPNLRWIVPAFISTAILMHVHWFRKWCLGQWRRRHVD